MSESFLATFMKAAQEITRAERSLAVDSNFAVVAADRLNMATIESEAFRKVAMPCLERAVNKGEHTITNNVITDPSQAPKTNTNFADLRIVVAFPVADYGALYLDQHIRYGVIGKDVVDRLLAFIDYLIANDLTHLEVKEMVDLYHELS